MGPQCIAPAAYSSDIAGLGVVRRCQCPRLLLNSLNSAFTNYYKQAHMWFNYNRFSGSERGNAEQCK